MAHYGRSARRPCSVAIFDPLIGLAVALWLVASTVRELVTSSGPLLWSEEMICGHDRGAVGLLSARDS
jgi:hypothetical protein